MVGAIPTGGADTDALGCAGVVQKNEAPPIDQQIETVLRSIGAVDYRRPDCTEAAVADLLARGAIIGWVEGPKGPAAQTRGNLRVLADPRIAANARIVRRGLAPSSRFAGLTAAVLEEHVDEWFAGPPRQTQVGGPVSCTCKVRPDKAHQIPAVTGWDDACRVQVVGEAHDPRLYSLLEAFCSLTGVPVLATGPLAARGPAGASVLERAIGACLRPGRKGCDFLVIEDCLISRKRPPGGGQETADRAGHGQTEVRPAKQP